jgi:invasion protein IalB
VVVKIKPILTGAFAALALAAAAASAQQAPAAPGRPDMKTVGDWQVRCFPVENTNPCDMFQERVAQQTQQRVLTFSLAFVPSMNRHIMQVTVPLDVALQKGVTIQTGDYKSPVMKYRMCNREGCFVQLAPDNAVIEALSRATSAMATINIADDTGKNVPLPLSLKGFSAAHDDMVAQARAKAKTPKPGEAAAQP